MREDTILPGGDRRGGVLAGATSEAEAQFTLYGGGITGNTAAEGGAWFCGKPAERGSASLFPDCYLLFPLCSFPASRKRGIMAA